MKNLPDNFWFWQVHFPWGRHIVNNTTKQVSQLLIQMHWKSRDIVDYASFRNSEIRNNFHLFFNSKSMFGPIYRWQDFFVNFHKAYPDLVAELDWLQLGIEIASEENLFKLYEAYIYLKLMNPNMVNGDLFA